MSVLVSRVKYFIRNLRKEKKVEDDGWEFCAPEGFVMVRK